MSIERNIYKQKLCISRGDRARLTKHKSMVIWLTGLSGSGKSTFANALEVKLNEYGILTYILDGDNVRQGLCNDLGFNEADRIENLRRVAEVSNLMMDSGIVVITSLISPFENERLMARNTIGSDNFFEIYVSTPIEVCEKRDTKGLYKRARSGEIKNMTGINSKYEMPINPDFVVNGTANTIDSVNTVYSILIKQITY